MKHILLITIIFFCAIGLHAQCTTQSGFVCISQETADRTAKALDEYAAAKVALAKYAALVPLEEAERAAFQAALKAANDAFEARGKAIIDRDAIIGLQQKVIEMYSALVEKLTDQISKPRSGWQKFVAALEKVLYIAVGVAFGRGL